MKYIRVMFGNASGAKEGLELELDKVNIAPSWNKDGKTPEEMGGFNFTTEEYILRWLIRGNMVYDVEIPKDAEVVSLDSSSAKQSIYRTNKIILHHPRKVTDEMALDFYHKSKLEEKAYYKAMAGVAILGYRKTMMEILKDKVNQDNIDIVLSEINDFVKPENATASKYVEKHNVYEEMMEYLLEIKSDLFISRFVDKCEYIHKISNDKVINITGESGSGKSYYRELHYNSSDYILLDTDNIFSNKECNEYELVIRNIFLDKYHFEDDVTIYHFDTLYEEIINCFKDSGKTIVIDSAQFRNLKDLSLLKGELIVIRTSIEKCYERCISRYISRNGQDIDKYKERKKNMFSWYKGLNQFLERVDEYYN